MVTMMEVNWLGVMVYLAAADWAAINSINTDRSLELMDQEMKLLLYNNY